MHQTSDHQFWQSIGNSDDEAQPWRTDRITDYIRQLLAKLKNLISLPHCCHAGWRQYHAASGRLEEGIAERALQFMHLGADGLHRHPQPVGRTGNATFLGDDPKIVKMPVAKVAAHIQFYQNYSFPIICFFRSSVCAIFLAANLADSDYRGMVERNSGLITQPPTQGANNLRTYLNNSPQAAARIVALAMLADGHLCKTEGESVMLTAADQQWGQHHKKKALPHPQPEAAHV